MDRHDLAVKIAKLIEGWDDGHQLRASYADDGAGHRDFMGFRVSDEGLLEIEVLLNRELER